MLVIKYLCAIFVPPLYFLLKKRWGAFLINAVLFGIGVATALFIIGIPFWLASIFHAALDLRKEFVEHHAQMVADKMVKKMEQKGEA